MRRSIFLVVLLCLAAAGLADAGQFRIAPPKNMRKRQPPPNYRESRLEIVNEDDRGYAIDVDYRRNRLSLVHRSEGDVFVPGNSSVVLVFDDDDDWRIVGDHESLNIEIRSGRTTTLRLETRANRHQVGLFGSVQNGGPGGRGDHSTQLFKYTDRPGRGGSNGNRHPAPTSGPVHRPTPPPTQAPAPRPPVHQTPPPPTHSPQPPRHEPPRHEPSRNGSSFGSVVSEIIDGMIDNDRPDRDKRPGGPGHRR